MKQFELLDMYREEGLEEGRVEGIDLSTKVVKRHNSGRTSREIAEELKISVESADDIIQQYENA